MKRIVVAIVVLVMASLFLPVRYAFACSCVPPGPDHGAVDDAVAVFSGTVLKTQAPQEGKKIISSVLPIVYTFEVDAVVKGDVGSIEKVESPNSGASCGYRFRTGHRYVVFAHDEKDRAFQVSLCSNTRELALDEDIDFAASFTPVPEREVEHPRRVEEGLPAAAWAGTVGIVLIGGIAFFVTRRRPA
jgi:hypothetical protein